VPEPVHVHAPHELTEHEHEHDGHGHVSNRERVFEVVAVLLLSVATLGVAWSGYQAAKWGGIQSREYAEAGTARNLANRADSDADEERLQDLLGFNRWLDATARGDAALAVLTESQFRDAFKPAFAAWVERNPMVLTGSTAGAEGSPIHSPEYRLEDKERSDRLETVAARHFDAGREATETGDRYVFATVFLAGVMFFAGISIRFAWTPARVALLVLALGFLAYGLVEVMRLPTA
jgi:hypothetical protein